MKGIMMIEELYRKAVTGRKTQTRRTSGLEIVNDCLEEHYQPVEWRNEQVSNKKSLQVLEFMRPDDRSTVLQALPRYKAGEMLYLKEPFYQTANGKLLYKYAGDVLPDGIRFKNKMFMPLRAARAFIRIIEVKCERLLDITEADCLAEGVLRNTGTGIPQIKWMDYMARPRNRTADNAQQSFLTLFRFANKLRRFEKIGNPWVWVYTFEYLPSQKTNL